MNKLGHESSSYLRGAAHQPVHWLPWGPEAFARAKKEDKPILLDVGAVWCHWCHVMDRESYENEQTAAIINSKFIAIKADRDERPDIDARFQRQVSAISGQGGWPLTAFLTPEGKCFYGGTYFPPGDNFGRPGFPTVLNHVADFYADHRDKAALAAEELHAALKMSMASLSGNSAVAPGTVKTGADGIIGMFDEKNGGFGSRPKFHHASAIELLLDFQGADGRDDRARAARDTLFAMARGGIRDHLAGGFHRYSVDEAWGLPHFEKMASDNAELLKLYASAGSFFAEPFFADTARDTARFVRETLMDGETGGFYSSQDADMNMDDDGGYFTWTIGEAAACLDGDEFEAAKEIFGLREKGDMPHDPARCVLRLARTPDEIAEAKGASAGEIERLLHSAKTKMLRARMKRPAPFVDRTLYANLNGMMISAFAHAGAMLGDNTLVEDAARAFERIMKAENGFTEGLRHAPLSAKSAPGLLDDYARMALAALDLYEASGAKKYLDAAIRLASLMVDLFRDRKEGGYFDAAPGGDPVLAGFENKPYQDTPTTSPNSAAITSVIRLWRHTGDDAWEKEARAALSAAGSGPRSEPLFYASYLSALDFYLGNHVEIVITGSGEKSEALAVAALSVYTPNRILKRVRSEGYDAVFVSPEIKAMSRPGAGPAAYVCRHGACQSPVTEPGELVKTLKEI